jgi:hypothetical protein
MLVVIEGIKHTIKTRSDLIPINAKIREAARGYSPRTLSTAVNGKVRHAKILCWQDGRLELLIDELKIIAKILDINFKTKGL